MPRRIPRGRTLPLVAATLLLVTLAPAPAGAHGGGPDVFTSDEAVYAVAWNPAGTRFAAGTSAGNISMYDGITHTLLLEWHAHDGPINQVAFSPTGAELASSSGSYKNLSAEATIKVWTLPDQGPPAQRLVMSGHYDWIPTAVWSPDGRFIASASGIDDHEDPDNAFGEVFLWDAATGTRLWVFPNLDSYPHRIAWSPDGRNIAAMGHLSDIWLLNATTHAQVRVSPSFRDEVGHASHGWAIDWSPDARYVVAGFSRDIDKDGATDRGAVVVFDTQDTDASGLAPLVKEAYVHEKPTQSVAWDSSGSYIASCSGADVLDASGLPGRDGVVDVGEVVIYNFSVVNGTVLQGMHIFRGGFTYCSAVDFQPGRRTVLAANADGSVRLYALDEDGDGCFVWEDDAPTDGAVCKLEVTTPDGVPLDAFGLLLFGGGVAGVVAASAWMVRDRARERAREEEHERSRRGHRKAGKQRPSRDGRRSRRNGRRGAGR